MTNNKEWIGEWYIPFAGEEVVFYGTLTYNPNDPGGDIVLKASSIGEEIQGFAFRSVASETLEFDYIEGLDHKSAKPIVLLKPHIIGRTSSIGLVITIKARAIIEGYSVINSQIDFDYIRFRISGIKEWLGVRGTKLRIGSDKETDNESLIQVEYVQPDKLFFEINSDFDLELYFSYGIENAHRFNLTILEDVYLIIRSKTDKKNFYVFTNMIEQLRRLLSVIFNGPCFLLEQSIHSSDTDNEVWGDQLGYNIYHRSNYGTFPIDNFSWDQMIVRYDVVKEIFPDIIKRWFAYLSNNPMNYVHWVLSKYPNVFSEDVFLEKARALEVFHRAKSNEKIYPDELKDRIIDKIKQSITLEYFTNKDTGSITKEERDLFNKAMEKVAQSLNFANEPSFSGRLKEIFKSIKKDVSPVLFDEVFSDYKSMIWKIVNDRNYYTHYSEDRNSTVSLSEEQLESSSLSIRNLYKLTTKINKALIIVVLNDLGIIPEITVKRFSSRRFEDITK